MFKKKEKTHAGPVEDKTALRVLFLFIYLFIFYILKQRSCSNCPDAHAHADLELRWPYVFFDTVPYFM